MDNAQAHIPHVEIQLLFRRMGLETVGHIVPNSMLTLEEFKNLLKPKRGRGEILAIKLFKCLSPIAIGEFVNFLLNLL